MPIATVYSRAQTGIHSPLVTIEVHLSNGLPGLAIVGLPETAVKESKERVRSAILNSRFEFPLRRIIVNLAPADLPKQGGRYDLAIALGILGASEQIRCDWIDRYEFFGELALTGEIKGIKGILPVAISAKRARRPIVIPQVNSAEAKLVKDLSIYPAKHLLEVCSHLNQEVPLTALQAADEAPPLDDEHLDFKEVKGQTHAKRALEIAAAGAHNLLMIGSPGTGKTMLAHRLVTILPEMDQAEALATAAISSISQEGFDHRHWRKRPFRAPHHSASAAAVIGGGSDPRPGEISLAHHGVLFLDEFPEFDRRVLEALREPLENGYITIARAGRRARFPSQTQLVAAMNPCPCGHYGDPQRHCRCSPEQVRRYRGKISGPLLDRIDMHIEVPVIPNAVLFADDDHAESSALVRARVVAARRRQIRRCGHPNNKLNAQQMNTCCRLPGESQKLLDNAAQALRLSARSIHRILKVARTIADLAGVEHIGRNHLAETIAYRCLDKQSLD